MLINAINNVNVMGSHRVRTFNIPRLCSSLTWWWPTAAETCCLLFNIFITLWLILLCFRLNKIATENCSAWPQKWSSKFVLKNQGSFSATYFSGGNNPRVPFFVNILYTLVCKIASVYLYLSPLKLGFLSRPAMCNFDFNKSGIVTDFSLSGSVLPYQNRSTLFHWFNDRCYPLAADSVDK